MDELKFEVDETKKNAEKELSYRTPKDLLYKQNFTQFWEKNWKRKSSSQSQLWGDMFEFCQTEAYKEEFWKATLSKVQKSNQRRLDFFV